MLLIWGFVALGFGIQVFILYKGSCVEGLLSS